MKNLVCKYKDKVLESGGETILCGIVNVTPDSFSDGGKWYGKDLSLIHISEPTRLHKVSRMPSSA